MTESIKLTDSQIHEITGFLDFDSRERQVVDVALEIYIRKHGGLMEDGIKDMLKHLESAGVLSESRRQKLVKKLFNF